MKDVNFPIWKTKTAGVTQKFNLNDPADRKNYFTAKAGPEIEKLKEFLETRTFVSFLMGKKNSGKGTYSKLFMETVGKDHVGHISIGDIVRDVHKSLASEDEKKALTTFMAGNFRGFHSVEEIEDIIMGRSTTSLLSSELVVALIKYEISRRPKKAIFIDGFPRALDQIGYSLFLKELIGYREDPDFMVFIDVPEQVIDERIKSRVICPKCNSPRNTKLALTQKVGYDQEQKSFFLICDDCHERMVPKEGDELGIEPIRDRLEIDDQISKQLMTLSGIPKIYLRNSVPLDQKNMVDDYEITPMYEYAYDEVTKEVKITEKPWVVKDDNGVDSYSLMPSAVAVGLIKQVSQTLGL